MISTLFALPLVALYPAANRIWGDDPRKVFGRKIGSHSLATALALVIGVPLGWLSAGLGGALVPVLFLAWRAIIISDDWSTPDTTKEVTLAFVRHLIPAGLVAAAIVGWGLNDYVQPFEWSFVAALGLHALAATILAVRFAETEADLAEDLIAERITKEQCSVAIKKANADAELLQGLTFGVAVLFWTLVR